MEIRNYNPSNKNKEILDTAYQHIGSVPYKVSLRWVFYRLLQEGLYKDKKDYENLIKLTSKARKQFFKQWKPDTLADETREAIINQGNHKAPADWLQYILENIYCDLDEWYSQKNYVEVLFEAKAMIDQFKSLVPKPVTLVPFGGDPSIPYKWKIAKRLEKAHYKYLSPIKLLYFGDKDEKGTQIPESAITDIRNWCSVPFDFIICGLTEKQAKKYKLPENPNKLGQYQWEALTDTQARKIVTETIDKYIDHRAFKKVLTKEQESTIIFRNQLESLMEE